jgi:branched-chain amino acid transport system ATP-binding protein
MCTDASQPVLQVDNLHKSFQGNHVLRGVTLAIARGRATALIGSNGAGKSTFLNLVSGLIQADTGTIRLNERDVTRASSRARARAGIARTFQHPRSFRSLTVLETVLVAGTRPSQEGLIRNLIRTASPRPHYGPEAIRRARECLGTCRLSARAETPAADLTYGEQKLLMLAQVLAFGGDLLCFDELCAGLEPMLVEHVRGVIAGLVRDGRAVLFIEHNLQLVRDLANDAVFLHQGAVFRQGGTAEVLGDPNVVRLYLGD